MMVRLFYNPVPYSLTREPSSLPTRSNKKASGRRAINRCHLRRQWARTLTSAAHESVPDKLNQGATPTSTERPRYSNYQYIPVYVEVLPACWFCGEMEILYLSQQEVSMYCQYLLLDLLCITLSINWYRDEPPIYPEVQYLNTETRFLTVLTGSNFRRPEHSYRFSSSTVWLTFLLL